MKILIADNFPPDQQRALGEAGHRITFDPNLEGAALGAALGDHEILVVRSTKVNADAIDAGAALRLVIRAGAGTNSIDKAHAAARGVRVCNVPGANANAVAELVIGLIIAIDRNIASNVMDLRNKRWDKRMYGKARGLCGMTLGILGLGAIGLAVAQRANAFGMRLCTVAREDWSEAARNGMDAWGIVRVRFPGGVARRLRRRQSAPAPHRKNRAPGGRALSGRDEGRRHTHQHRPRRVAG